MRNVVVLLQTVFFVYSFAVVCCAAGQEKKSSNAPGGAIMKLTSTAFSEGAMIPVKYTCDGANVSPPFTWAEIPQGAATFALICEDPDAPAGTWVHWVVYNIPAKATTLPEKMTPADTLADGTRQGISDFRKTGYGGPCPPGGTHRYFFKLYALDTALTPAPGMTKVQLLKAMEGHILAQAELMGRYKRK